MYKIHKDLKDKISNLNKLLANKYKAILSLDRDEMRSFIESNIGEIIKVEKLENKDLAIYETKGGIVGVDGSTNKIGGAYPHFVEFFQGLAKSTIYKNEAIFISDINTPLSSMNGKRNILEKDEKEIEEKRNILLATVEVQVAIESVEKFKPYAILMDGSLIRYSIYCNDLWIELRDQCEKQGVLLLGVIEDIKTSVIGDKLGSINPEMNIEAYDRELLFGQLDYGEMIIIKDKVNKKKEEGYSSIFMRTSLTPTVIGMDIIDSQSEHIEEMARLILTLTPENSRGIPLWLDIVDQEVKLSDKMMKGLVEEYLDRDIYERFFIAERSKR